MPSIASFIRELLSEDKYSSDFSDRIEDRVKQMNVAQLQGLHAVLTKNRQQAKTTLWQSANQTIIDRIQTELKQKEKEFQKEQKLIEEYRIQQRTKIERMKAAKKEEIRVKQMIAEKSRQQAEKEVMDKEYARQNEERFVIMKRVFEGEEARNKWWIRLVGIYVVTVALCVVILSVLFPFPIYVTIGAIFVVTCTACYAAYRCHLWTIVKPIVIPKEQLESQIETREQELTKQAQSILREKERHYQEQVRKDKIEKKKRKLERKEKQRLQIELLEAQRVEKIVMAREIIEREKERERLSQRGSQSVSQTSSVPSVVSEEDDLGSFALESVVEGEDEGGERVRDRDRDGEEEDSVEHILLSESEGEQERHRNKKRDKNRERQKELLLAPGKDDEDDEIGRVGVPEVDEEDDAGVDTDDYGDDTDREKDRDREELLGQFVDELLLEGREMEQTERGKEIKERDEDIESQVLTSARDREMERDGEDSVVTVFTASIQGEGEGDEELRGIYNIYRKKPIPTPSHQKSKGKYAVTAIVTNVDSAADEKV